MRANAPVSWFETLDSTNSEAHRRAAKADFEDQWICAHRQGRGRGRLGRVWVSEVGNLYTTALFQWHAPLNALTHIPFAAGLAVADTAEHFAPNATIALKWPNDVRCNGAKIGGILIESGTVDQTRWVAVGIGINIIHAPSGLDQAAACLKELSQADHLLPLTSARVFEVLRHRFFERLSALEYGFEDTRQAWLKRADGHGGKVRIRAGNEVLEGIFDDLDTDGALILQLPTGSRQIIRSGDVDLIREVS